jgi:hypothetical protein
MPLMATHNDIFCLTLAGYSFSWSSIWTNVLSVFYKRPNSGLFSRTPLRLEPDGYYTRLSFNLLCYLLNWRMSEALERIHKLSAVFPQFNKCVGSLAAFIASLQLCSCASNWKFVIDIIFFPFLGNIVLYFSFSFIFLHLLFLLHVYSIHNATLTL